MSLFRKLLRTCIDQRRTNPISIGRRANAKTGRKLAVETLENRRVLAAAVLNEIVANPGGTDQPYEYIEIKGIPNAPATNLYFVSIEGDNPGTGLADYVFSLDSVSFGSNGLIVIAADGAGHTIPAETSVFVNELFNSQSVLENGTNSFALIHSPTAIVQGTDLDVNNDGVLELPSGAEVWDMMAFSDGGVTDISYGPSFLIGTSTPPGAATRFRNDNRPNESSAWYFGVLPSPNSNVLYSTSAASISANFPVGGQLTPGFANAPGTNTAPLGNADDYTVEPGGSLSIAVGAGVLANDSDADGIQSVLAASLSTAPTLGTLTFNADGSFQYVSNGTPGVDSFTYRVTDLEQFSSTVTVTINVEVSSNVPPTLSLPLGPFAFNEGDSGLLVANGGSLTDSDSLNFATGFLTVAISNNADAADVLSVQSQGTGAGQISRSGNFVLYEGVSIGNVSGGVNGEPLQVDFNANASLAAVQALVQAIQFSNTSDTPSTALRTLQFIVNDGDGGQDGPEPVEVNVIAANDSPVIQAGKSLSTYTFGDGPTTLDGLVSITDIDSVNFEGGALTVAITSNSHSTDILAVRNAGVGIGQVGVSGASVSFEGNVVGTIAGGSAGVPLTVSFNANASALAVQAIARAITFNTSDTRVQPADRVVQFTVTDGDGGSDSETIALRHSLARRYGFQEGVDSGKGTYSGAADVQLSESQPNTNLPQGANPATEGLLVDYDGGTANSQVLLRFDNIFGNGPGQIPLGSKIAGARLVLDTNNPGDGGTLHRLLTSFDANVDTWNTFANGVSPRNTSGAVQTDDTEAKSNYFAQIGVAAANSDPDAGPTVIGVTEDIQAWANGETNLGWLIKGWESRTDGWAFSASESASLRDRPRLEIDWVPASVSSTSFRDGENGYLSTLDTSILEATPDAGTPEANNVFVDANDVGSTNNAQVLLRFEQIIGGMAGQIPAGALIHAAYLDLASTLSNAEGDGGTFHRMLTGWDESVAWSAFTDGIQANGVESNATATTSAGDPSVPRTQEAGFNSFDVTSDLQAWVSGVSSNFGWAILPYVGGSNGWGIETSESASVANRPKLRVFYSLPGVTVTPNTALETSEAGGTASFNVVLNAPPSAPVTIAVSSSDTTEGTVSVNELTFTPDNWDVPQVVTVSGVDDALVDGDVVYQVVLADAVSTDPNYNALAVADLDFTNTDNDTTAATPATVTGVVFGDGTAQRSMVKSIQVNFSQVVTADPGAFVLQRRVGGVWVSIPSSELVINAVDVGTPTQSQYRLTFSGTSVIGGSLADGNYRLTIQSNLVRSNGLDLDGDNNGTAGGDFVRGNAATDNFFRLFGDFNGSGGINVFDINAFRAAVGTSNPVFDFNSLSGVNVFDLNAFRSRVGQSRNF